MPFWTSCQRGSPPRSSRESTLHPVLSCQAPPCISRTKASSSELWEKKILRTCPSYYLLFYWRILGSHVCESLNARLRLLPSSNVHATKNEERKFRSFNALSCLINALIDTLLNKHFLRAKNQRSAALEHCWADLLLSGGTLFHSSSEIDTSPNSVYGKRDKK
jgi:hypothetical protein